MSNNKITILVYPLEPVRENNFRSFGAKYGDIFWREVATKVA